jgi:hypothetical protein
MLCSQTCLNYPVVRTSQFLNGPQSSLVATATCLKVRSAEWMGCPSAFTGPLCGLVLFSHHFPPLSSVGDVILTHSVGRERR